MRKQELVTLTKDALGLQSKVEAEGFLKEVDALFVSLANGLEVGDKAKVGEYFTVEKVHVEEKSGVAMGVEYTTPAHDTLKIKLTKSGKELVK